MPIVAGDIDFHLSGGTSNTDPNASLGGVISNTQIVDNTLHNLFDKITGDESLAGDIEYRGYYVKNAHGTLTLEAAVIWIQQNTTNSEISIALAAEAVNVTMATIANESTAPSGITFSQPANKAAGLSIGNIPAGQFKGIWVKRDIGAATLAEDAAEFHIKVEGDTAE